VIASLRWIKANVAAFGGNPDDVTAAGQSSGGTNVCSMMASPLGKGLFQHAIVQSGVCGVSPPLPDAEKAGAAFAAKLGCREGSEAAACLRGKSAAEILDASDYTLLGAPFGSQALPQAPMAAFTAGNFERKPTLIGYTRDEMWSFQHARYPMDEAKFKSALADNFKERADAVAAMYPTADYPHIEYALGGAIGDMFLVCPSYALADAVAKYAPVSMYEFADRTAPPWQSLGDSQTRPPGYRPGASHTAELVYLLAYKAAAEPLNSGQNAFADELAKMWVEFGHESPSNTWIPYDPARRSTLVLQLPEEGGVRASNSPFAAHHCDFWNK
jgi:para-nitrobenzyl esterase